jgi:hypothetical protein
MDRRVGRVRAYREGVHVLLLEGVAVVASRHARLPSLAPAMEIGVARGDDESCQTERHRLDVGGERGARTQGQPVQPVTA